MKFAVLISGALGFAIVAGTGLASERQSDLVLRDAALACLGMAFIGRWFWSVVDRAFAETMQNRRAAAEAAAAEPAKPAVQAASSTSAPTPKTSSTRPATAPAPSGATR